MEELVELIVDKYDGSLKAEHGTGVNMAPYVEREWGAKATEMMWRVKGSPTPTACSTRASCSTATRGPPAEPEDDAADRGGGDACVECGFCEPVCPSRDLTTTPRQRIVLRREMARQPRGLAGARGAARGVRVRRDQTCAADGTCQLACPVGHRHRQAGQGAPRSASTPSAPSGWRCGWPSAGTRSSARRARACARAAPARGRAGADARREPGAARARVSDELVPELAARTCRARRRRGCRRPRATAPPPSTCRPASTGSSAAPRTAPSAAEPARGAGRGLRARRPAALDPAGRRRALLRDAVESKGYDRRRAARMANHTVDALWRWSDGGAAAGRHRRELVHARPRRGGRAAR